jgi:hypothetical protein
MAKAPFYTPSGGDKKMKKKERRHLPPHQRTPEIISLDRSKERPIRLRGIPASVLTGNAPPFPGAGQLHSSPGSGNLVLSDTRQQFGMESPKLMGSERKWPARWGQKRTGPRCRWRRRRESGPGWCGCLHELVERGGGGGFPKCWFCRPVG